MNKITTILTLFLAFSSSMLASDNIAYVGSDVRITVVSPSAVRLEYAPSGVFLDNPSFVCIGRDFPKVKYKVKRSKEYIEITTSELSLRYRKDSGAFSSDNLQITSSANSAFSFDWNPSMEPSNNLGGTEQSLDGVRNGRYMYDANGRPKDSEVKFQDGLLSRNGYTLFDNSNGSYFSAEGWITPRDPKGAQDWWFVAYGENYKRAISDFSLIMGTAPMLPRYAFGAWWSRYWMYTQGELEEVVETFQDNNIPLDIISVDMDWHFHTDNDKSWFSWTVNPDIFPDLRGCLDRISAKGATVEIEYPRSDLDAMSGIKGKAKRVRDAMLDLQYSDPNLAWFPKDATLRIWTISDRLASNPQDYDLDVREFLNSVGGIDDLLKKQWVSEENAAKFKSFLNL